MARKRDAFVVKCWGILTPQKNVSAPTIRTTRRLVIHDYVRLPGNAGVDRAISKRWTKLHKWGWRCVPVYLSMEKPQ